MARKRRAEACKQKITERCVNISKIKKNYLSPTTPFALYRGKNSATEAENGKRKTDDR